MSRKVFSFLNNLAIGGTLLLRSKRSIRASAVGEALKFVREAVRTYPELYFARFTVLGEGASVEVVLPQLADALGFAIDRSFVAVVPLGGRHVNHQAR